MKKVEAGSGGPRKPSAPSPSVPDGGDSLAPGAPDPGDAKKRFLLRLDPAVHAALEKWAADELRSVNAEIEFLLKEALKKSGRLRKG
jgi:hypothetical protein